MERILKREVKRNVSDGIESRECYQDPFKGTVMFYSFCQWLFRWKWLVVGVGVALTALVIVLFGVKEKQSTYAVLVTPNMIPDELVGLEEVELVLSNQLKNDAVKLNFHPRIYSSKIKANKSLDGKGVASLEVELRTAIGANADALGRQLACLVFQTGEFQTLLKDKRSALANKQAALDTLLVWTKMRIDVAQRGIVSGSPSTVGNAEYVSLSRELNRLYMERVEVRAELLTLSQYESGVCFSAHELGDTGALKKTVFKIAAVWVVLLFVAGVVWSVGYFYRASEREVLGLDVKNREGIEG